MPKSHFCRQRDGAPAIHRSYGRVAIPGDQPDAAIAALFVVGVAVLEDARQLLQAYPDVGHDKIEAVGPVSIPNMRVFEVRPGEVKQIDTPYP
jgi:hypothetical protein